MQHPDVREESARIAEVLYNWPDPVHVIRWLSDTHMELIAHLEHGGQLIGGRSERTIEFEENGLSYRLVVTVTDRAIANREDVKQWVEESGQPPDEDDDDDDEDDW